jgi:hypothetical protein
MMSNKKSEISADKEVLSKMNILIIDSHKSSHSGFQQATHWTNAKIISDYIGSDFIWSYPSVNDDIRSGYDAIVFVHASHYAYTDYKWLENSPDAKLFYVVNEYNLGEPRTLWMAAKEGRKYTVIANHSPAASKIVMKYVEQWHNVNINALVYNPVPVVDVLFPRQGTVYFGSYRKNRKKYFEKYFDSIVVSTHQKNHKKFRSLGVSPIFVPRINWKNGGLFAFENSLYIEDEATHTNYNYLSNRFYEALNYNCVSLFDRSCQNTINQCGYEIGNDLIIDSPDDIGVGYEIPESWYDQAEQERFNVLDTIASIIESDTIASIEEMGNK